MINDGGREEEGETENTAEGQQQREEGGNADSPATQLIKRQLTVEHTPHHSSLTAV